MKELDKLRELSIDELQEKLLSIRREQFNLRLKKASGALEKTNLVRILRRNVARVKTIMTEKVGINHVK